MNSDLLLLIVTILVALIFDFLNGFHDAANSIATVVSTRVLSPKLAVLWAAFFNFAAAFLLGVAVAKRAYKAYLRLLSSPRWMRAYNAGARPQRLLWASTGTKDPKASDVLYVKALAAPFTVNTMPEGTLKALAEHGSIGATMPADGGDCEDVLARFAAAGIDVRALSTQLQEEGAKSFTNSWSDLMSVVGSKCALLKRAS